MPGECFGASAPADVLLREYSFTVDEVCRRARTLRSGAGR
jgi:transketolase